MWPDSRKSFLLLEKSVMKQLALLRSSYPSGYPWSRREGQVISLAVPFLWFCAQRRHVRCESCEGKVLSPCRNAVLWSGGNDRKHWWKGTVMSLFPLLLLIWNVINFGFIYLHSPPPPPTPFFFNSWVVLWWLIQSGCKRLSVTENCSSKCMSVGSLTFF